MIFELAKDFAAALAAMPTKHPKWRMLTLLEETIRRDNRFIGRHPTTLFQCMLNTCWRYDCRAAIMPGVYIGNKTGDWLCIRIACSSVIRETSAS